MLLAEVKGVAGDADLTLRIREHQDGEHVGLFIWEKVDERGYRSAGAIVVKKADLERLF